MAGPKWIDEALSRELPLLRDRGEGQHLEFMERYPENGYELSKEIAAFASSNSGTILIGVADDGSLAGRCQTNWIGSEEPANQASQAAS